MIQAGKRLASKQRRRDCDWMHLENTQHITITATNPQNEGCVGLQTAARAVVQGSHMLCSLLQSIFQRPLKAEDYISELFYHVTAVILELSLIL